MRTGEKWFSDKNKNNNQNIIGHENPNSSPDSPIDEMEEEGEERNENNQSSSYSSITFYNTEEEDGESRNFLSKQVIQDYASPIITIILDKALDLKALIDTGSTLSYIDESLRRFIGGTIVKWPYSRVRAVNGEDVTPDFIYERLEISFLGKNLFLPLGIMPNIGHDLVLGMDFVKKFNLCLDLPRNTIFLSDANFMEKKRLRQVEKYSIYKVKCLEEELKILKQQMEVVKEDINKKEDIASEKNFKSESVPLLGTITDKDKIPEKEVIRSKDKKFVLINEIVKILMTKVESEPERNSILNSIIEDINQEEVNKPNEERVTEKSEIVAEAIIRTTNVRSQVFQMTVQSTEENLKFNRITNDSINGSEELNSPPICTMIGEEYEGIKPRQRKIIPRLNFEYILGPSEKRIITTHLDETHSGLFMTKTLKSAKKLGLIVEKGVITANNKTLKVWVQNKSLRPKNLKVGDGLFQLKAIEIEPEDLIEIKTPTPPNLTAKQRRRKEILGRNKVQSYDSYNEKVWEKLNSIPNADLLFLTPTERKLEDTDPYFENYIDKESYEKWNVSPDLSPKQKFMFWKLLEKYRGVFAFKGDPLGKVNLWTHKIDTGEHPPIKQNPYRTSEAQKLQIQECVNEMMEKGVIIPCVSSWSSPVTLVPKKDGTIRFCIDYRKLNAITKDDLYPIPRLDEPLALMRGSKYFSVMDCDNCYWQIPLEKNSMEKTTFTCHLGTFMFKVMPFGLKCAPASCVRAMDRIFKDENRRISFIYMDDLICYSDTPEEHIRRLSILFDRMFEHGLKLKAKKCQFANDSVNYLGHTITIEGISPDRSRFEALLQSPPPNSVDNVRSFLGFCGFYRNYVINFTMIAEPLTRLLRKNAVFVWGEEQQKAHKTLIDSLINAPVLAHYDPTKKTELRVDASNLGLGAHLVQIDDEKKQLLACASRTLLKHEKNYSTTEKECLAIVFGLKKFRPYLFGRKFVVVTDHCGLCFLMGAKDLENRLARWSLKIMDYNFDIVYNKGAKHQDADFLSRNPFKQERLQEENSEKGPDLIVSPIRIEIEEEPIDFSDWKPEDTIEEQKKDLILKDLYQLCENPTPLTQRHRQRFNNSYQLKDGVLHKKTKVFGMDKFVICLPLSLVPQILYYAHDSPIAAHFGQRKTYWRICQNFYWKDMVIDIKNYVRTCKECQFRKTNNTLTQSYAGTLPIPEKVFETIAIDIVGPLPTTEDGFKHIVTVTDALSKYAVTYPIRNATDDEIMEGLEAKIFYVFGPPKHILKDQGTNLNSVLCKRVYDRWGIQSNRTTPYHPQGNGQTERFNKTLGVALTTMIPKDKEKWIDYLNPVTYGYNSVINETTGFTPLELITGDSPDFSHLQKIGYCSEKERSGLKIEEKRCKARENILKSQQKNQIASNAKRIPCNIQEGDLVLIFSTPLKMKKGGKFENRWTGPYRVIERLSEQIFTVISISGRLDKTRQVNATNIKKYFDRKDFELCATKNLTKNS